MPHFIIETIQQTWIMNPLNSELVKNPDPDILIVTLSFSLTLLLLTLTLKGLSCGSFSPTQCPVTKLFKKIMKHIFSRLVPDYHRLLKELLCCMRWQTVVKRRGGIGLLIDVVSAWSHDVTDHSDDDNDAVDSDPGDNWLCHHGHHWLQHWHWLVSDTRHSWQHTLLSAPSYSGYNNNNITWSTRTTIICTCMGVL